MTRVGFPGAMVFIAVIKKAYIIDVLEIRLKTKRSFITLIFFQTQTNIKLIKKMLKSVKIKAKVIVPLPVLIKWHIIVGKGPNQIPARSAPTKITRYEMS